MALRYLFSALRDQAYFALLSVLIAIVFGLVGEFVGNKIFPAKHIAPTYSAQLETLDRTKQSINQLLTFIDEQQKQLRLSQDALASLQIEQGRLQPLVEADRKVIDAMFAEQEQRNQSQRSKERWRGFGYGVASSVAASLSLTLLARFVKR